MALKQKPDYVFLVVTLILIVFGLIMLSSASVVLSYQNFGNNYYYFTHQLLFGVLIGLVAMFVAYKIDYHKWKKFAALMLILTLVLLILVFIPGLGFEYGGARRWVNLGPLGTIQPTEIAKLTFLLYLATWLDKRSQGIKDWKYSFAPFLFMLAVVGTLTVLQPDVGTMSVIMLMSIVVYFVAGGKLTHLGILGVGAVLIMMLLIKIAPYRMSRFTVFLNPELDPQGIGYQINQSLLAVGSGGILGRGLGKSIQKHNYLPEASGDSIFAVIAEEMGFVRIIFLLLLFLFFAYLGFRIAKRAPDMYGKLIATGITAWVILQALINISAMISLIPLTGIPLPFISYGGSAIISLLAACGIMLNISKQSKVSD
ncbi:MAG: putative lipid II flippase FtsW [Patescibacteria group bacterium]|nr:putative lipid II flippase FtsW [Patescibacteria group bacterium]